MAICMFVSQAPVMCHVTLCANKTPAAGELIRRFDFWDHFQDAPAQKKVLGSLMEYHASVVGVNGVVNRHPRIGAAVAEAVYAIGGERNPKAYRLSCFAPLIQNLNAYRNTPYDILFTSDPEENVLSASYYQQQMFNRYPGTQTLPVTESNGSDGFNPLFWVASIQLPENEIYFKIVNAGNTSQNLNLKFDVSYENVNGTILAPEKEGDLYAYNYIHDHTVVPKPIEGLDVFGMQGGKRHDAGSRFNWTVPAFSVSILQFNGLSSHHLEGGEDSVSAMMKSTLDEL